MHRARAVMQGVTLRGSAGVLVSVVAIGAVVWWGARQEAPQLPTAASDLLLLGAALLVYGAATLARGWRWHQVLVRAGTDHSPPDAYALICVGYMGNTVLPARGGEALRIVLLADRAGARKRDVLGSIVAERMFDTVALVLLFATLTLVGVAGAPAGVSPAVIALGALAAGAVALHAYGRLRRAGLLERFAALLRPVTRSSRLLLRPMGALLVVLTGVVWLSEGLIFMLVGQSLGLRLELLDGAFLVVLASFFALIPAAPGYAGTYDAALLFGLGALDVAGGVALSFVILVRFVLFGPITLVGLGLLVTRYGGIGFVRRRLRERRAAPSSTAA